MDEISTTRLSFGWARRRRGRDRVLTAPATVGSDVGGVVAEGPSRQYGDDLTSPVSTTSKPAFPVRGCSPTPVMRRRLGRGSWRIDEAPVSTQRPQTEQETRCPLADEHPWGPRRGAFPSPEGPSPAERVIERLSGRRAFDRLRIEGRRCGRGPLRLVYRPDPQQTTRVAFALPRSVGHAVVRNRIRRRIRAVLGEIDRAHDDLPAGGDYLVRVTAPIDHWSHARLLSTMTDLLATGPLP